MSKIGILTYHHVINWGSALQAVCLYKFLANIFPGTIVEIINYTTQTSENYNKRKLYSYSKRFGIPYRSINKDFRDNIAKCKEFLARNVVYSSEELLSDELSAGQDYLIRQNYDAVFVGSDTVLQLGPYASNRYIAAPQAPNLYFLPFSATFRKFGFAVSVDPFRSEHLSRFDRDKVSCHLNDFDNLFYRDHTTKMVLEELNVAADKMGFMPDPSLLLDFELLFDDKEPEIGSGSLAAVAIGNSKITQQVMVALKELGFTPINLMGERMAEHDILRVIKTFGSYVKLFKFFKAVVTDRFHGSIKSILVGDCPIIGIEEVSKYPEPNSKIRDLFKRFGIDEMIIRSTDEALTSKKIADYLSKWKWRKKDFLQIVYKMRFEAINTINHHINID